MPSAFQALDARFSGARVGRPVLDAGPSSNETSFRDRRIGRSTASLAGTGSRLGSTAPRSSRGPPRTRPSPGGRIRSRGARPTAGPAGDAGERSRRRSAWFRPAEDHGAQPAVSEGERLVPPGGRRREADRRMRPRFVLFRGGATGKGGHGCRPRVSRGSGLRFWARRCRSGGLERRFQWARNSPPE